MKWKKEGLIFKPDKSNDLMFSHAAIPCADLHDESTIRIYFSSRNKNGQSLPFYLDVLKNNPKKVINICDKPILNLGDLGTFDESGIMPSCIVNNGGEKYMYYIAWNTQVTVSYRLSIGLAVSNDNGNSFKKISMGPICDRSIDEPFFNTAPFVMRENNVWRMWYISCTKWEIIDGHPEPYYHVKYAESKDGIYWEKNGIVCIDYDEFTQAIGRPSVIKEDGIYKMFYSFRRVKEYRSNPENSYRLGYAESNDGKTWTKHNDLIGIYRSDIQTDWDSVMIEYCHVLKLDNRKIMFYNGNGFGETGFGLAILES